MAGVNDGRTCRVTPTGPAAMSAMRRQYSGNAATKRFVRRILPNR
ncbi:hypothetical protein BUC_5815 [Burkholderia pseudomallei 576]|nr:hypothetical protein BUC_5815 [Burkholderia pseudomallei 576]